MLSSNSTTSVPSCQPKAGFKFFARYDLCVLAYFLAGWVITYTHSLRFDLAVIFDFKYIPLFVVGLLEFLIVYMLYLGFALFLTKKDNELFGEQWRSVLFAEHLTLQRLYDFCHIFVALQLVLAVHAILKQAIPLVNSNLYDEGLLRLDHWIHGGINPVTWCISFFNTSSITTAFDRIYLGWFQVQLPVVAVFILCASRRLSESFFFAFFSLWLFGGLLSVLLPSLGPVYVYPEWFTNMVKPSATILQHNLISHYFQYLQHPGSYDVKSYEGVAAFPSLHVAVVALFAYFIWRVNRCFSILMGIYALLIQIGSVLLGWHYAVDGYFGAALSYLLYRVSLRIGSSEPMPQPEPKLQK